MNLKPKSKGRLRICILGALALAVFPPQLRGGGTDPLLERLIAGAVSRHPDLEAMKEMVEAAVQRQAMSRSLMNPELTVGVMGLPSTFEYNVDPGTALQVGIMQKIPWKGRLKASDAAAGARVEVERFNLETDRQNMAAMIAMIYYDLAAMDEDLLLLKEGLKLSREMTSAATWMTGSAMGRLSDVERARLEEENWKLKIIAREGEIKRKRADLAYALGMPVDTLLLTSIVLPEDLPTLPNLDSLLSDEIIADAPVIHQALSQQQAAEKDLKLARLDWYPDFDVMLSYDFKPDLKASSSNGNPAMLDQMNMISLGVTFPLPLWYRGNQQAKIAEMKAMNASASRRIEDARLSLIAEISRLHADWEEQNTCCEFVQQTIIARAENLYRTALIDYRSGRTPFMELSQARMSLVMAKMELAMSKAIAWGTRARLLAALGKLAPETKN